MKLTRTRLKDFRGFGEADFDLTDPVLGGPLDVALIVGSNGSGKSSLMQALTAVFTALWPTYGGERLRERDVREGAPQAEIAVAWRDWLGWSRQELHEGSFNVKTFLGRAGPLSFAHEEGASDYKEWLRQTKDPSRWPTGLIVGLDVYRLLLPPRSVVGPTSDEEVAHRCALALAPTVSGNGRGGIRIRARVHHLKQWIVNLDARRAKAKADRGQGLPIWHTLRHALNRLLDPYTFEGVDERFQVLFQTPTGRVPIEALSDGFRSVFVVVAELLFRLDLSTEQPERVLEGEAVCLIDEIDAHLHPHWQENVIPGLRALFPNVQFIATTHSEIVVSTVEPKNVFRLEER